MCITLFFPLSIYGYNIYFIFSGKNQSWFGISGSYAKMQAKGRNIANYYQTAAAIIRTTNTARNIKKKSTAANPEDPTENIDVCMYVCRCVFLYIT